VPERRGPSNKIVSRSKMPCRRTECKACNRSVAVKGQVLEMLSYRLGISQVVVLLDEAVEELSRRASSYLMKRYGKKSPQRRFDWTLVDLNLFRRTSFQERIRRSLFPWWKPDDALLFQIQQKSPADHVLGLTVWLRPAP